MDAAGILIRRYSDFTRKTYNEKLECLFGERILYADGFSREMRSLGQDAHEIVWDFKLLQESWARDNGVLFDEEHWQYQILTAQVRSIRPDVVYFQGTEATIPGRFIKTRQEVNLATLLKQQFPFIKLIAIYSGFPTEGNRMTDVDVVFSCSPSIQGHYRRLGISTVLCYHAFDQSVLGVLNERDPCHDFTFLGSSRAPESRYWFLRGLLENTPIKLWANEPVDVHKTVRQKIRWAYLKKRIRQTSRSTIRNLLLLMSLRCRKLIWRAKWVPGKIRRVAKSTFSDDNSIRDNRYYPSLEKNRRVPKVTLREMYPTRCQPFVVGLEYFQLILDSRISFNRHTDSTGTSVGNMRMFESTGVGSCLLTDSGSNMKDLFQPEVEVVTYTSLEEAVEKVTFLLENEGTRKRISRAGQERTLKEHTVFHRCEMIDHVIQEKL